VGLHGAVLHADLDRARQPVLIGDARLVGVVDRAGERPAEQDTLRRVV